MNGRRAITTEARRRKPAREPVPAASLATDPEAEIGSLSRQLARHYGDLVESHRRAWGITATEAVEKARMPRDRALEMVRTEPVEQLSWWALATAMEHDPEATLAAWKRIGDAARQEWRSGHRTAQVLERRGTPYGLASWLSEKPFATNGSPVEALKRLWWICSPRASGHTCAGRSVSRCTSRPRPRVRTSS